MLSVSSNKNGEEISHPKTEDRCWARTLSNHAHVSSFDCAGVHPAASPLACTMVRVSLRTHAMLLLQGKTLSAYASQASHGVSVAHDESSASLYVSKISRARYTEYHKYPRQIIQLSKKSGRQSSREKARTQTQNHSRTTPEERGKLLNFILRFAH